MSTAHGHKQTGSVTQNHKAQLANAYNELGKELSSTKIKVVGNYTLGKVIGEGAYGKVRLGTHRLTSTRVAIKQIPKAMSASLTREIHHHRQLHHPHVTQMYEVIATESSIWIVTELCSGGELFDYLAEKGRIGEDETKIIFGQLCLAVAYLHEKGIVHRDLKLENVLLDEKCRIKLGDFGFTREFDRGVLLETFCGTTGYAAPEMLQGKKYLGPEVDVWSLGIILYCLLTGTLPFDDDHEDIMRDKIIQGEFEDPEWLSTESRDLIKNIIQQDPTKRLTISQILAHPWFTSATLSYSLQSPSNLSPVNEPSRSSSPVSSAYNPDAEVFQLPQVSSEVSSQSTTSDSTFLSASSELATSIPTTPNESLALIHDTFISPQGHDANAAIHHNLSQNTLNIRYLERSSRQPDTIFEQGSDQAKGSRPSPRLPPLMLSSSGSGSSKMPPASMRTPARTKRRSVSSNLSDPASPIDKDFASLPLPPQDFASLLSTPTPMIFSTPLERKLLNSLSMMGFDTGQIVHSVLSDACDAAGAVWWMLKRRAEKKAVEDEVLGLDSVDSVPEMQLETKADVRAENMISIGVQTDASTQHLHALTIAKSAPQLAFVPPTPTVPRPLTPTRPGTPTRGPLLSPTPTSGDSSSRSHPSTPAGSLKDKDGSKARKVRSGSVSIMQRANTALEAVGLVKKKSSEAVRDDKEKDWDREIPREREKSRERRLASGEEPRSSHGSGSSKRAKSPPLKPPKDHPTPSTPPSSGLHHPQPQMGSPWVITGIKDPQLAPPTPANSPGDMRPSNSIPENTNGGKATTGAPRHRANLLTAFRLWFHEDRKGKRKESAAATSASGSRGTGYNRTLNSPIGVPLINNGTAKRRSSGSGGKVPRVSGRRPQRQSISSRRSSSVNSRRSSGTSVQMMVLDSPHHILEQVPTRRSLGSHTPNSERGEYSSRPSSIRSFSMPRHRKSPSASSASSAHFRTTSPVPKYHKRAGSGSSTRVVRQIQATHATSSRPTHMRSNSTTSSIHSPASSRPASFYDPYESDGQRTSSPLKPHARRSLDDTPRRHHHGAGSSNTTFIAQKRQTPFLSPVNHSYSGSIGRSSWKKSWGLEPPGWQTRTMHLPIEVLAVSPAVDANGIRDVFSGRQSLNLGDESDWVDEDDDIPAFAGGLGQLPASLSAFSGFGQHIPEPTMTLSPAPRGHRPPSKRTNRSTLTPPNCPPSIPSRQKAGHSPVERVSPIPSEVPYEAETRGGRRQLPAGRSGPAFKHPIQEEDEGEEE